MASKVFSFQTERGLTSTIPLIFVTQLQHFLLFLSKNVSCLYRGAGYKTSIQIRNSAWEMSGVDEVKPQHLTYKTSQLHKDYGTLKNQFSNASPSISFNRRTEAEEQNQVFMVVCIRITQEGRKRLNRTALVFHPQFPG